LVVAGEVTAAELLDLAVRRIESLNPTINAVITTAYDRASQGSKDGRYDNLPLKGVPYLIKDLSNVEGIRSTYGSRLYLENIATENLNILGKSNTPEFGLISTTQPVALGACRNPWHTGHTTGGSSGGAAAAVASGMLQAAQASDGGGSIRIPASCCGVFGLKPSRGRMFGETGQKDVFDLGVSHAITRSVRDSALLLSLTEGDSPSMARVGYVAGPSRRRLRIAFTTSDVLGREPGPDVLNALEETAAHCERLGHDVIPAAPEPDGRAFEAALIGLWSARAAGIARSVQEKTGRPAAESGLLETWTLGLADLFAARGPRVIEDARKVLTQVSMVCNAFMADYDVMLTPVLSEPALPLAAQSADRSFEELIATVSPWVAHTPMQNVAGLPAMSVPLFWSSQGLPIGSQFTAARGGERTLLELAYELEASRPWANRWPPINALAL
jgi:amidase